MSTPQYRVAYRYRQFDRKWWEVFANNQATVAQVAPLALAMVPFSLALRNAAVFISHIRISNILQPRDSTLIHVSTPTQAVSPNVPEATALAAIYRMVSSTVGVKRTIWLRGLNSNVVARYPLTGQDYPTGGLDGWVTAYFDQLARNSFGITALVPVDTGINQRVPILSITVNMNQTVTLNCASNPAASTPPRWILYRINQKYFPTLKGHWPGTVAGNLVTPTGFVSLLPPGTYNTPGAALRQENYRFGAFANPAGTFMAFDRRDTEGGPLGTRGRSRAALRRFA